MDRCLEIDKYKVPSFLFFAICIATIWTQTLLSHGFFPPVQFWHFPYKLTLALTI